MKALLLAFLVACSHSKAASPPTVQPVKPTPSLAPAMAKLGFVRGVWRGVAEGVTADGKRYKVTQTERMGPMLGGDVIVIEGRGYESDGSTGFNALAVVSWEPHAQKYEMRAYAQGNAGTFELTLTADGYVWQIPAGPDAIIKYTATVTSNHWREVGEYIAKDQAPVSVFEMNLDKVGETDWPLTTPITPSH